MTLQKKKIIIIIISKQASLKLRLSIKKLAKQGMLPMPADILVDI